jgi:hypothetical protein
MSIFDPDRDAARREGPGGSLGGAPPVKPHLGFRLLILQEFAAFLKSNRKECFLTDEHWAILARLAGFLSERANALIRGRAQTRRVEVQRSKTTWKPDLPRAA